MNYEGQAIQTVPLDGGFVELKFDLKGDSVNKFNALTMGELKEVVEALTKAPPKGLLVTSGKDVFIVGADVTEFLGHFKRTEEELTAWLLEAAVRYTGKPVSVPTLQSLPVLFPFTLTRPLAYVISNSPNLDLRSEGPSSQFVALRTTI